MGFLFRSVVPFTSTSSLSSSPSPFSAGVAVSCGLVTASGMNSAERDETERRKRKWKAKRMSTRERTDGRMNEQTQNSVSDLEACSALATGDIKRELQLNLCRHACLMASLHRIGSRATVNGTMRCSGAGKCGVSETPQTASRLPSPDTQWIWSRVSRLNAPIVDGVVTKREKTDEFEH